MKVGFIVECGPQGAETKVIPHLARMIDGAIEPEVIPLDRKPLLKEECGKWAKALLDRGCRHVLIVWDLLPDWGEYEGKGCQRVDRQEIFKSLKSAGVNSSDQRVRLVCIHQMLEAWLVSDERALSGFLSRPTHKVRVPRRKDAEIIKDPKAALNEIFRKSGGPIHRYVDWVHAIKIVEKLPDLKRLQRSQSFRRFEDKLILK